MVKNVPTNAGDVRNMGLIHGWGRSPGGESMATHSSILAWRIHGQQSLEGYSPKRCKKLDATEVT